MAYTQIVSAALSETRSKFALAEALAIEIPEQEVGRNKGDAGKSVLFRLEEARDEIRANGGEPRSAGTLDEYRRTALWVSKRIRGHATEFFWVADSSFTAHNDARKAGMSYEDFAKQPLTSREIRAASGGASKDGDPKGVVSGWSPKQKRNAVIELAKDPDVSTLVGRVSKLQVKKAGATAPPDTDPEPETEEEPPKAEKKEIDTQRHLALASNALLRAMGNLDDALKEIKEGGPEQMHAFHFVGWPDLLKDIQARTDLLRDWFQNGRLSDQVEEFLKNTSGT